MLSLVSGLKLKFWFSIFLAIALLSSMLACDSGVSAPSPTPLIICATPGLTPTPLIIYVTPTGILKKLYGTVSGNKRVYVDNTISFAQWLEEEIIKKVKPGTS